MVSGGCLCDLFFEFCCVVDGDLVVEVFYC